MQREILDGLIVVRQYMKNDGKQMELLIQLIERSISPDSVVEHNVFLPILNSPSGATAQCDIVISSGKEPRKTLTIVEAQDRRSKVKINDFRGWKQKLDDVGAQHLLCVSRKEFPQSIKEQAALSGNSIILVTLKESEPENLPLDFINLYYQYRNFDVVSLDHVKPSMSKSEAESLGVREALHAKKIINSNEHCWSVDGHNLLSLFKLCRDYYIPPEGTSSGTGNISFDLKEGAPLYHLINGVFIRAGLDCEFKWTNEIIEKPVSVLTYEQNEFGALAWVAEIIHDSPKGKIVFRMPITKQGENYIVRTFYTEMPENMEFTFGPIAKKD